MGRNFARRAHSPAELEAEVCFIRQANNFGPGSAVELGVQEAVVDVTTDKGFCNVAASMVKLFDFAHGNDSRR
jgi:hypothetical protein